MRTLILSDLHLGNDEAYDIFAGRDALPALLGQCCDPITRVVLNGDTFDFLLDDEPLGLSVTRAVAQACAIVGAPSTARVLKALGRVLHAGGEVVIRLGNHDVELALSEVQEIVRDALQQPAEVAARLRFEWGDKPAILEVGGVRILLAHGEHNDPWNRPDYSELPGPGAPVDGSRFRHPPGSALVKTLLNPLKKQYGMRFADLLKPDFRGAVLTALAVDPGVVKLVFQQSNLSIMWQLFRRISGPASFADVEPDMGLADVLDSAALGDEEREALAAAVDPMVPLMFSPGPTQAGASWSGAVCAFSQGCGCGGGRGVLCALPRVCRMGRSQALGREVRCPGGDHRPHARGEVRARRRAGVRQHRHLDLAHATASARR